MAGGQQTQFVTDTSPVSEAKGQVPYLPTGYETDQATANQKRAIANALIAGALHPDNTGIGGVIERLGDAFFGKMSANQATTLEGALNQRKLADHQATIAGLQAATAPRADGSTPGIQDVYNAIISNPRMMNDPASAPYIEGMKEWAKNSAEVGPPADYKDANGNPITLQYNKAGGHQGSGGITPEKKMEVSPSGIPYDPMDLKPGVPIGNFDLNKDVILGSDGQPRINDLLVSAKQQSIPPSFQGILDPNSGNIFGLDRHRGGLFIPPVGPAPGASGVVPAGAKNYDAIVSALKTNLPGMVTDTRRTPNQQLALQTRGATTAGVNGPHVGVNAHAVDMKPEVGNSRQAVADAIMAKTGVRVDPNQVIDERGPGQGTGPHWHVGLDTSQAPKGPVAPMNAKDYNAAPAAGQVSDTLNQMGGLYTQLHKLNAIADENQSGLEYVGHRLAAKIDPGFISPQAQSIRSQIISLRRPLAQSISKTAGMTARQLDSNQELSSWLDALTDPSQSYQSVQTVLQHINSNYGTPARAQASMARLGIPATSTGLTVTPAPSRGKPPVGASPDDLAKFYLGR